MNQFSSFATLLALATMTGVATNSKAATTPAPQKFTHGINWNFPGNNPEINTDSVANQLSYGLNIQTVRLWLGIDFSKKSGWLKSKKDVSGCDTDPLCVSVAVTNEDRVKDFMKTFALVRKHGIQHISLVIAPHERKTALPPQIANYETQKASAAGVPKDICEILTQVFNYKVGTAKFGDYINLWELANEVNFVGSNYWLRKPKSGTGDQTDDYIESYLKPAADCLHGLGVAKTKISTAGFNGNSAGALAKVNSHKGFNYVGVAAVHMYEDSLQAFKDRFAGIKKVIPANTPIAVTEWGFYGKGHPSMQKGKDETVESMKTNAWAKSWAASNTQAWAVIHANATIAHYFGGNFGYNPAHGKCSALIFNDEGKTKQPDANGYRPFVQNKYFFEALKLWAKDI